MEKLTENIFLTGTPDGVAVVNFSQETIQAPARPVRSVQVGDVQRKMVYWGAANNEPGERALLIEQNNIVPRLLQKRRNMILGAGVMIYKERFVWDETSGKYIRKIDEMEMPPQIQEFLQRIEVDSFLRRAASELVKHGNIFSEFLEDAGGRVVSAKIQEALYVRAEKKEKEEAGRPRIPSWFIHGDWTKQRMRGVKRISNHDPKNERQTKYLKRFADEMFGGPWYYSPSWWGSRIWIQLANCIPLFHLQNLQNGYLIRYHIRVPKDYFLTLPAGKSIANLSKPEKEEIQLKAEEKKMAFMKKLNEILTGVKNAGRTLFTTYDIKQAVNGTFPGVEITPIQVDLKDAALLELFDKSNIVATSSQGLHPSLTGVQTDGKLSSGSDIRNALALYLSTDVQEERRITFGPLNFIAEKNGWFSGEYAGAKFGARDVVIVTTDKDPRGIQENTDTDATII